MAPYFENVRHRRRIKLVEHKRQTVSFLEHQFPKKSNLKPRNNYHNSNTFLCPNTPSSIKKDHNQGKKKLVPLPSEYVPRQLCKVAYDPKNNNIKLASIRADLGMDFNRDADQRLKETAHAEDLTWYYGPTLSRLCLLPWIHSSEAQSFGCIK